MVDGTVLIDSKLNADGVKKGSKEIEKALNAIAKTVLKAADNIEKSFENVDFKKAFEELPKAFQDAYAQIETIRVNDLLSDKDKVSQIAAAYKKLGVTQSDSIKKAWATINAETVDGSHKVIDDLQDIAKEAETTGEKVSGVSDNFKELFGATFSSSLVVDGLKQIAGKTVELGKQAIQFAAEVNASNAQFEQTFKGVEETARATLKSIQKEVGITETRMQDGYTAIFAFAKSVGADTPQALDIAARAMIAAADVAAYYDMKMEDALETVLSYIKGNYENDAALGFASTETTRAAKANQMYAKSFEDLTAAQNVDVLLAMVEGANEASGAMGQAAREADSWTNVSGELKEAWRQFLAVMGNPVLKSLIPIIQGITDGLQRLIEQTASVELTEGMESFKDSISGIDAEFEATSQTIEKNALMADFYKTRLEELEATGLDTAGAQREYANAVEALNGIYPDLNLQINEQTGLLDDNSRAQLANIEAMKQKALFAAMEKQYTDTLSAQAEAVLQVREAEKALTDTQAEKSALQIQLREQTGLETDELVRLYTSQMNAAAGYISMDEITNTLTADQMELVRQFIAAETEIRNLQSGIEDSNNTIAEYDAKIDEMSASMQSWADQHSTGVAQVSEATTEAVAKTGEAVAEQNGKTLTQIERNTTSAVDAITKTAADAANQFDSDFAEPTQESVSSTGEVISESISTPADTMKEAWQDKAGWFKSNVESPITESVGGIRSSSLETWGDMESDVAEAWRKMVENVEQAIGDMQSSINSLTGKTVTVTVNKVTNSTSSAAYEPSAAMAIPVGIPYLASGAVIPPHAPFVAVLGDQPSGVNIEAPLETIKQAVAEVNGNQQIVVNINFEGDLAQLGRILKPVIDEETRRLGPSLSKSFISG